jgi:hypothetical protein
MVTEFIEVTIQYGRFDRLNDLAAEFTEAGSMTHPGLGRNQIACCIFLG